MGQVMDAADTKHMPQMRLLLGVNLILADLSIASWPAGRINMKGSQYPLPPSSLARVYRR